MILSFFLTTYPNIWMIKMCRPRPMCHQKIIRFRCQSIFLRSKFRIIYKFYKWKAYLEDTKQLWDFLLSKKILQIKRTKRSKDNEWWHRCAKQVRRTFSTPMNLYRSTREGPGLDKKELEGFQLCYMKPLKKSR